MSHGTFKEYVVDGAILHCPFTSSPITLKATDVRTVKIQSKAVCTEEDKQAINNNHSECIKTLKPCTPMLMAWINSRGQAANVLSNGHVRLLDDATIRCSHGDVPLTFVNSGQISTNKKLLYLCGGCFLLFLFKEFYLDDKRILDKVEKSCRGGMKSITLSQVTDFEWDTVYIQYGLSTEFMYDDYNLSGLGEDNVTETYGLSMYFIKNGHGVYMENHKDYTRTSPAFTAVVHQPPFFVEFDDLFFESHKGKRERISISAIFNKDTELTIKVREIRGSKICTFSGGIGDVSGIYSGD